MRRRAVTLALVAILIGVVLVLWQGRTARKLTYVPRDFPPYVSDATRLCEDSVLRVLRTRASSRRPNDKDAQVIAARACGDTL